MGADGAQARDASDGAVAVRGRRARSSRAPRRTSSGVADARKYLAPLARILVHSGHSPQDLLLEFSAICRALKEPAVRWDASRLSFVADLPHVITY